MPSTSLPPRPGRPPFFSLQAFRGGAGRIAVRVKVALTARLLGFAGLLFPLGAVVLEAQVVLRVTTRGRRDQSDRRKKKSGN